MMSRFMKLSDVAKLLGVSRWTLREWIRDGRGPAFKRTPSGRGYLFREEDVLRWFDGLEGPAIIRDPDGTGRVQTAA